MLKTDTNLQHQSIGLRGEERPMKENMLAEIHIGYTNKLNSHMYTLHESFWKIPAVKIRRGYTYILNNHLIGKRLAYNIFLAQRNQIPVIHPD